MATGEVLHECMPPHRHQKLLRFMKFVEKQTDPGLEIHVILDNYATHKHAKVRRWLERNPGVHFHFIPTGASWLNLVERFFSELIERQLRRLAVTSVDEFLQAFDADITHRNGDPTPVIWTKSAQEIIEKIQGGLRTLEAVQALLRHLQQQASPPGPRHERPHPPVPPGQESSSPRRPPRPS